MLSANDVVVYDRGYYAYEMLHAHAIRGLHAVFWMKRKTTGIDVDCFIHGSRRDTVIEVVPRQRTLTRLRRRNPGAAFGPHRLRLVKYAVGDTVFILGTTLLDRDPYSIDQLSDLYHARWGIEERYKVSKQLMEVEDFHGQSERGVKQELYACFTLIAMTRLFANHGEDHVNGGLPNDGKPLMQTNFKHGLAAVAANIESLLLQQASALRETVARMVGEIVRCRQRLRPGRSYERRSRKPVGKWQRSRGAGEHRHRQLANGIKNQRITKAQDRILNRMAKFTKRMPLLAQPGGQRLAEHPNCACMLPGGDSGRRYFSGDPGRTGNFS